MTLDVRAYVKDGFQRVCGVESIGGEHNDWTYTDINKDVMYADHRSWVYFITVNNKIWKIGETGNPLGILAKRKGATQPRMGSTSRLGRYRAGCMVSHNKADTDYEIRRILRPYIEDGHAVEIWAKRCSVVDVQVTIGGKTKSVGSAVHKELEMAYIDHIRKTTRKLPVLNKLRK
ncbi:MAG: hypothetical protein LC650_05130 [Actinobacteria bacterium]|nr:hypothetical protein [Actinomycetota bacterium]